jgi:SAM-dependent methyltransferase
VAAHRTQPEQAGVPQDPPAPRFHDLRHRDTVADLLATLGYGDAGLRELLGADILGLAREPGAQALLRRARNAGPLGALATLFLAGSPVDARHLRTCLGAMGIESLRSAGLIEDAGETIVATAGLTPARGLLFAHDLRSRHRAGFVDYVLGPGPVAERMADLAAWYPAGETLDLGCGCGVLGALAATRGGVAVGSDLNSRACAFTAFNAALNGLDRLSAAQGNLFEAVGDRRFDRIFCNPPYVLSPAATFTYRDGRGICERIVRAAPDHLTPGGLLQMSCNWPHVRGRDPGADLAAWFDGAGCDVWILQADTYPVDVYAGVWLGQEHADSAARSAEFGTWMDYYDRQGIEAVSGGMVVMRRIEGRPPRLEIRPLPTMSGDCGGTVVRIIDAWDRIARLPDHRAWLALRPGLVAEAEGMVRHHATATDWLERQHEIRLCRGLAFSASLDPVGFALAARFDGRRTVEAAVRAFAGEHGLPVDPLLAGAPDLVRELLERGILEISTTGAACAPGD